MDETTPQARKIARWTEAWLKAAGADRRTGTTWLVVSGPTGIGKSHAMRKAFRFLVNHNVDLWAAGFWKSPPSPMLMTWSRVVDLPREDWEDWVYDLRRSAFVFLDDIGSEVDRFRSGEPAERLRVALDICEKKWLMVTTNATPTNWATVFDARVRSRLERAASLDLTGASDFRVKAKGA
jgi:chromosomal replication initiation ATPase DnaA